jgi:hypothetical protein
MDFMNLPKIKTSPSDILKKISWLLAQMNDLATLGLPAPIVGETISTIAAAYEIRDLLKNLVQDRTIYNLDANATKEYAFGCLINNPHIVEDIDMIETYVQMSTAILGESDCTIMVEIPSGNLFQDKGWMGDHIDMAATRANIEETVQKYLDNELSIPLWDSLISIKATDEFGEGNTCIIKTPLPFKDIFQEEIIPQVENALDKALSGDLADIVEDKPENKFWKYEQQAYVGEEIVTKRNDIKFVTSIEEDDLTPEFYDDDGMTPGIKRAFENGDWGYVYVKTVAVDEYGDEVGEPVGITTSNGMEEVQVIINEQIDELLEALTKPKHDDGFRQIEMELVYV